MNILLKSKTIKGLIITMKLILLSSMSLGQVRPGLNSREMANGGSDTPNVNNDIQVSKALQANILRTSISWDCIVPAVAKGGKK